MNRYYAIPDIHGNSFLLESALNKLYDLNPEGGKIIFLGDYIDRGKDNLGVIKTVMNPPQNWTFIPLRGNHEQMFLDSYFLRTGFYDFDTAKDLASISRTDEVNYDYVHSLINKEIIDWMNNLKIFHIEDQNVFAHAYYDDAKSPEEQNRDDCIWFRLGSNEKYDNANQKYYLVHGHTPKKNGPILAINRLNLDCGAVLYNRLVVAEFERNKKGAVDFLEFTV